MKTITKVFTIIVCLIFNIHVAKSQGDTSKKAASTASRALSSPLKSPPFPGGDWLNGPIIGQPADTPHYALGKLLGLDKGKSGIQIYGWINPSYTFSTSKNSNIPVAYNIMPNSFELDQLVLRIERQPNTVQTDHFDWGFRISNLYGLDYRYTVAKGWFSGQYFKHNNLYGYDNAESYVLLYFPKVGQGMVLKAGRFISPPDIEAQLATDNYLFSHSVMFSYDPFTLTGIQSTIKLSKHWQIEFALHGGNDMSVWTNSSSINGQAFVRWVSNDNNDGIWAGINSLGTNWKYKNGHDDLQMVAGTWGHKFSDRVHMMTEAYYEWERDAATGGSASDGPVRYGAGGGPGPIIPGISAAVGVVNYFQILVGNKDKNYVSIRNDYLNDTDGWRTGYKTTYISHTIGFIHYFTPWLLVRPEIRYDYNVGSNNATPYDLGSKKYQFTAASDLILRF